MSEEEVKEKAKPSRCSSRAAAEKGQNPKRRRIVVASDSDDSGEEFKPDQAGGSSDEDDEEGVYSGAEVEESEPETEPDSPVKPVKRKRPSEKPAKSKSKPDPPKRAPAALSSVASDTKSRLSAFSAPDNLESQSGSTNGTDGGPTVWDHEKLEWLQDGKRKDGQRKRQSDENYDPTTLYVPDDFLNRTTPGIRRWWQLKSEMLDTVLFYKVGKFYELYHMDAVIGVNELGLTFMKGTWAHSGFPEIGFGRFSDVLVQKGYKVARVEQTETPEMMEARCKTLARPLNSTASSSERFAESSHEGLRRTACSTAPLLTLNASICWALKRRARRTARDTDTSTGCVSLTPRLDASISVNSRMTVIVPVCVLWWHIILQPRCFTRRATRQLRRWKSLRPSCLQLYKKASMLVRSFGMRRRPSRSLPRKTTSTKAKPTMKRHQCCLRL